MPSTFIPLLADAGGSIVFIIVLVISVISWLVNLVQGNNPKGGKPKQRPRPDQGQSDLEKFLQEVVGNKPQPQQEKPRPPKSPRPQGQKKAKSKSPAQQRPAAAQAPVAMDRPGARLQQTHLATAALGDNFRNNSMDQRSIDSIVKKDIDGSVRRDIDDAVQRDIGADGTLSSIQRAPVHPLILAMRSPGGVRQAIMMAEILGRPKSLRQ